MLPKKNRIRKDADFGIICHQGKSFSVDGVLLRVKENDFDLVRLGVSVGLKFSPKAVDRNRIKRQIRDFFGKELEKIKKGQDFVVVISKGWDKKVNPATALKQILVKNRLFKE